MNERMNI